MTSPTTQPHRSRLERLRPHALTSRRRVVVAFGLAVVFSGIAGALPDTTPALELLGSALTLLAIFVALGLGVVLRWSVRSTADLPDEQLDERLIRERDAAYLTAYQLIAAVAVVTVVGLDIAVSLLDRSGSAQIVDVSRVTGALLLAIPPLALFAPSAVLAWRRTEV